MSTDDSLPTAVERLAISRQRLREVMRPDPATSESSSDDEPSAWLNALKAVPGASVVIDAVQSWWGQHPMRLASLVAVDASKTFLRPMIRRNPAALVAGAVVVGGLIMWMRPWRGLLKPAIFAGLVPHLVSRLVAHVPMESWMSAFSSFTRPNDRGETDHAADAPETAQAAQQQQPAAQQSVAPQQPPPAEKHSSAPAAPQQPASQQPAEQRPVAPTAANPAH